MTRKETTKFLSDLLIRDRFSGMGKYWAREVTLNYGSADVKRVDFMQFKPPSTYSVSGIEKGEFICYEVKSCVEELRRKNRQNAVCIIRPRQTVSLKVGIAADLYSVTRHMDVKSVNGLKRRTKSQLL